MLFRKSINIKYDVHDNNLIKGYYPTSSHSEIISQVLDGINLGKQRSHITFGPYGAGKSYISSVLIRILSKKNKMKDASFLSEKFSEVDSEISQRLVGISKNKMEYIPVLINGYEGEFSDVLKKSLQKALLENKMQVFFDGYSQIIQDIISTWNNVYPEVAVKFKEFLNSIGFSQESFDLEISLRNENLINSFDEFYRTVTAGASLPTPKDIDVIEFYESVSKKLAEKNKGIIVVHDEFGRQLQNIDPIYINRFMEQLQSLAELANNGVTNLSLLFIAHKPISHYFTYLDRDKRSEFSKIEKRFTLSEIRSDHTTFINITRSVISSKQILQINDDDSNLFVRNLRKYKVFSLDFNDTEVENTIVRGCYPLHPIALFLLPRVSSIFGQNERTLFTFLGDESSLGLSGFIDAEKKKSNKAKIYYPDNLADYFFATLSDADLGEHKEVRIFQKNYHSLNTQVEPGIILDAQRVYKFCSIWNTTNSNGYALLTRELISFSLNIEVDKVDTIIKKLVELKVLRFNHNRKFWELVESSSLDISLEINKRRNHIILNKSLLVETLNTYNRYRVIYSHEFNHQFEMTRFARVNIYIEGLIFPKQKLKSDFDINVLISTSNQLVSSNDINTLMGVSLFEQKEIDRLVELLVEINALDSMQQDRYFLSQYKNIEHEINYEKSNRLQELENYLEMALFSKAKYLDKNNNWVNEVRFNSMQDLEVFVDKKIGSLFHKTVVIKNDQVNMFEIARIQEKAVISVIDKLLKNQSTEIESKFVGNKPDGLLFYSIISQVKMLSEVFNEINEYIYNHEGGSISELSNILANPPYGFRPAVASVILTISLLKKWKNLMFFDNESYIAELPPEYIYEACLGIRDFEYTFSQFEFDNRKFIDDILLNFDYVSEGVKSKSLSIQACSGLYNWYLKLAVVVQLGLTGTLSIEDNYRLKSIKKSKTNPLLALQELVELFEYESISEFKYRIEASFDIFLESLEYKIKQKHNISDWYEWAKSQEIIKLKTNKLVKVAFDHKEILRVYSKDFDVLEIERWPLSMFNMLIQSVENDIMDASGEVKTVNIAVNGQIKQIQDIELSPKSALLLKNISNLIDANARYITNAEIEKLIIDLMGSYIK